MLKKILTIDDLITFCEKNNFSKFDSKTEGYQICVAVPAVFEKEEAEESDLLMGVVKLMHTGRNRNGSNLTEDAARNCMKNIAYKPVLANFTDVNGELDFTFHDFEYNEDDELVYYEKQVGCFTADKPTLEEEDDRKYIYAKCAIPRDYTAAADIIERKNGTKISAELCVKKCSYDSKEKELLLEDVVLLGATLLGVDPDTGEEIGEGMEGARVDIDNIEDFSINNNSVFSKSDLINEITQAIFEKLDNHIKNQGKEECGDMKNKKVNLEVEAAEKEVTPEVVDFEDTEDTEDVESEDTESNEGVESENTESTDDVDVEEEDNSESDVEETDDEVTEEEEPEVEESDDDDTKKNYNLEFTVTLNGVTRNFSISLVDKLSALSELVNTTYSESDNEYYCVDAIESDKEVYMHGYWTGKHYKQSYSERNGVFSLKGDRVEVYCNWLTKDEEKKLEDMKSNYAEVTDKLSKYESEPDKMAILNSNDYSSISEMSDFAELKKQENHFDLSVDEVKEKADAMLLQYAKSGKLNFAQNSVEKKEEPEKKDFFAFARVEKKNSFLDGLLKRD